MNTLFVKRDNSIEFKFYQSTKMLFKDQIKFCLDKFPPAL